jgi:transcriptional regulator with XRE-family HTH domain
MSVASIPAWCRRIKALRKSLQMSQSDFAAMLNISAMTVSRWESGKAAPSPARYLELGRLAGNPRRWYFWNLAGIRKEDFREIVAEGETDYTSNVRIPKVIAALETQARLCEMRTAKLRAIIPDLPTIRLRRDYLDMSRRRTECLNTLRKQIATLKQLQPMKKSAKSSV